MHRMPAKLWFLVAVALLTFLSASSWGRASEKATEFDIPAQSLDSALLEFAKQADVQISVSTTMIVGMRTQGVVGLLTPAAALGKLLSNTGLQFTTVGERTFSVSQSGQGGVRDAKAHSSTDSMRVLAQNEGGAPTLRSAVNNNSPSDAAARNASKATPDSGEVQAEVVVTGTSIRGVAPVGVNLVVIGRDEIDRAGFATAQDIVRSLPQNFGGGPSEEGNFVGVEASNNLTRGTGVNLRGLGAGATLVLVNGRRLSGSGLQANFVDVSTIPVSAIERVEVLADGASALYGSDAIGGVVNYVLRKNFDGAETRARFGSVTEGDAREYQFGQMLGNDWETGHGLLSVEYYKRDSLAASERELSADSDLTRFGGSNFSITQSNPGTIFAGTQTWAIPRNQNGQDLEPADFVTGTANFQNTNEGRDLLPEQERRNVFATFSQSIGERFELFADALYGERDIRNRNFQQISSLTVPLTNPFYVDPTGANAAPVRVRYNFFDDLGPRLLDIDVETVSAAFGAAFKPAGDWKVTVTGAYGSEKADQTLGNQVNFAALNAALADTNEATAFNPFGDGSFTNAATLDTLRTSSGVRSEAELRSASLLANGPMLGLPGGDSKLAFGAEYLEPSFSNVLRSTTDEFTVSPDFKRTIKAAFAEYFIPLVSSENGRPGMRRLELSLAARYEDYSDFGTTTNPKLGALWAPADGLAIRGTWGTSFKAPNLANLYESAETTGSFINTVPDPQSGSGTSDILQLFGANSSLKEETATAWSVGAEFTSAQGLMLALTYYDIDFEDRIQDVPGVDSFLVESDRFASIVIRDPTPEQRAEACTHGFFFGDPADCMDFPIAAIVDGRIRNTAIVRNKGLDFAGAYEFQMSAGTFGLGLNATYLLEVSEAESAATNPIDLLDTVGNPQRLRLRGNFSWNQGPIGVALYVNHAGAYTDNLSDPNREIDAWTTADLALSYSSAQLQSSLFEGIGVYLNVQNVFDEDPPFFNNASGVGYDLENADPLGRMVSLQVRATW